MWHAVTPYEYACQLPSGLLHWFRGKIKEVNRQFSATVPQSTRCHFCLETHEFSSNQLFASFDQSVDEPWNCTNSTIHYAASVVLTPLSAPVGVLPFHRRRCLTDWLPRVFILTWSCISEEAGWMQNTAWHTDHPKTKSRVRVRCWGPKRCTALYRRVGISAPPHPSLGQCCAAPFAEEQLFWAVIPKSGL